jgi:hypothetical protein
MRSRRALVRPLAVVLGLAAVVALVVGPVWPGVFTPDSRAMYMSGPSGTTSNQYAPVIEWIWGIWTDLGTGPWLGLMFGVCLVVGGLFAVYTLQLSPIVAVLATAVTVLWPAVYGFLGWVGRGVWFTGFMLLALAMVGRLDRHARRPLIIAGLAFAAAWFAAAARQNGFPVLVIVAPLVVYLVASARYPRRLSSAAAVVVGLIAAPATLLLAQDAATKVHGYPEQPLYYVDLLAVSLRLDESQLSREVFPSQDLNQIRPTWAHDAVGQTIFPAGSPVVFDPSPNGGRVNSVLRSDWEQMIRGHPVTYLGQRLRLQLKQLSIGQPAPYPYFAATDQFLGPENAEFTQDWPRGNVARLDYLKAFGGGVPVGGRLFNIWPYLLLGWIGAAVIAIRSARLRLFALTALAVQVALQVVLTFAALKVEFRFEAFQVVLGVVMVILALAVEVDRRREPLTGDSS